MGVPELTAVRTVARTRFFRIEELDLRFSTGEQRTYERLAGGGYEVATTPFGWFCEWDLSVYGESLAKVWKEV